MTATVSTGPAVSTGLAGVSMNVGDHICAFYRGDGQRDEILFPYLRVGLEKGDKCVCVLDRFDPKDASAQVVGTTYNPTHLKLLRSEDTYLSNGSFSSPDMLAFWASSAAAAFDTDGYRFLRAAGEMTWALRDVPGVEDLVSYEAELNRYLPSYPQTILCLYDLEHFTNGEVLLGILRTHPKVLISGMVVDNPWYVEPDVFFSAETVADESPRLRCLLILAQLLLESTDETQIVQLAVGAAKELGDCITASIELDSGGGVFQGEVLERAGASGGYVDITDESAVWAYPIHVETNGRGWLAVSFKTDPDDERHFLLRSLAQHVGAAVRNLRLHEQERRAVSDAVTATTALEGTLAALRRTMDVHARLTEVASSGEGRDGIALAVHELTGLSVVIEDQFGNLRAWAGGEPPDMYPKQSTAQRERLLERLIKAGKPIRVGDRWIGISRPQPDIVGVMALIDPGANATDHQLTALEHGLTVLAVELARLRSLAETELRIRRDLVEELLTGTDEESALRRAQALQYDLERPHRVVLVEGADEHDDDEAFLHAVRRVARDTTVGTLLVRRGQQVVLLADHDVDWNVFRQEILDELHGGRCRIGVGQRCQAISDLPRSLRQAEAALTIQSTTRRQGLVTCYDDLGVFQLFAEMRDAATVDEYVLRWLSPLIDYDAKRSSDLVDTLGCYLECGGNYDDASATLFIHRSTLKYRLNRIREITGFDLNHPDTRFNLQLACRAWETLAGLRRS